MTPQGVAVGGGLVEVGEQLGPPQQDALGEGGEGGELGALDGAEEALEPALGLGAVGGAVDRPERLLEPPRLGDQGLAREQRAEPAPLALSEPLSGLEQSVPDPVEVAAPAGVSARAAGALRPAPRVLALAFAPDRVERGVRAAACCCATDAAVR
jgi:hypothetical protein